MCIQAFNQVAATREGLFDLWARYLNKIGGNHYNTLKMYALNAASMRFRSCNANDNAKAPKTI